MTERQQELIDSTLAAFREVLIGLVAANPREPDDELTIEEAALVLRSSTSHVKTLLGQRGGPVRLPHHKRAGRIRILRRDVDRYCQECATTTAVMRDPVARRRKS